MLARPDQLKTLTKDEQGRLIALERTIEKNEQSNFDALKEIKEDCLYREQFDTFDDYIATRWPEISKATFYRRKAHLRVNRVVKGLTHETKPPEVSVNLSQLFDRILSDDELGQAVVEAYDLFGPSPNADQVKQFLQDRNAKVRGGKRRPVVGPVVHATVKYSIELLVPVEHVASALDMLRENTNPDGNRLRKTLIEVHEIGEWIAVVGAWIGANKVSPFRMKVR